MDVGRIGRNGVAADRMIVAYSHSNGAAANHEIAWVTVALQHLSVGVLYRRRLRMSDLGCE